MDKIKSWSGEYNTSNAQEFHGSAQDWLQLIKISCRYEKLPPGVTQARALIDSVNLHLSGQARSWAFSDATVTGILLSDVSPDESVEAGLAEKLRTSLVDRFPSPYSNSQSGERDWLELDNIKQGSTEELSLYYQRLTSILFRLGGKDVAHQQQPFNLILQRVVKAFCSGLQDERIEFDVKRQLPETLSQAYELASKYERFWKGWGDRPPAAKGPLPQGPQMPIPASQPDPTNAPDRAGFPPAKTEECFKILPATIQQIIKDNGKKQMCFKCGDTGHYANMCENPSLS